MGEARNYVKGQKRNKNLPLPPEWKKKQKSKTDKIIDKALGENK